MSARPWIRRIFVWGGVMALIGCAQQGPPPLYQWETFPRMQYDALLRHGAGSPDQIPAMEAQAEKARAANAALPPGFRAHLGMLKLSVGDIDRARELLMAEKVSFPESASYMDRLLKQLQVPARKEVPANKENPA